MTKEEFIGKMQMAYFGDRNALEECTQEYLKTEELYNKAISDSVRESKRRMDLEKALRKIEKFVIKHSETIYCDDDVDGFVQPTRITNKTSEILEIIEKTKEK